MRNNDKFLRTGKYRCMHQKCSGHDIICNYYKDQPILGDIMQDYAPRCISCQRYKRIDKCRNA